MEFQIYLHMHVSGETENCVYRYQPNYCFILYILDTSPIIVIEMKLDCHCSLLYLYIDSFVFVSVWFQ